jgi:hypothetical protein
MTDRKILFFDIDGTVLTDDGKRIIPESTRTAVKQARDNGHLTFINTGRVFVNIEDAIRNIGFDGYICGCGTYIRTGEEVLLHNELEPERCRDIAHMCRKCGMGAIFEHTEHTGYDSMLPSNENNGILTYFKAMNRKLIDDIDSPDFVFDKFSAWYTEDSDLEAFKRYIEDDFVYIQREGMFCEIIPKGFSKATGIEFLLKHYDIPLENSYAFGDSNNDLDMLSYVPNSIAMGVCTPEVERVSAYKTDTVLGDGIYKAMKHFGII